MSEDGARRAVLTADDSDGFAVWISSDDAAVPEDDAPPLPEGVSHLLA